MSETNDCPGGCGTQISRHRFACTPCWFRLPASLRPVFRLSYHRLLIDPNPHRRPFRKAYAWYRDNPQAATR